jgi:hypothetical protein
MNRGQTQTHPDPVVAQIEGWRLAHARATSYDEPPRTLLSWLGTKARLWPALREQALAWAREVETIARAVEDPIGHAEALARADEIAAVRGYDDIKDFLLTLSDAGEAILAGQDPRLLDLERERIAAVRREDEDRRRQEEEDRSRREEFWQRRKERPSESQPDETDRQLADNIIDLVREYTDSFGLMPLSERRRTVDEIAKELLGEKSQ